MKPTVGLVSRTGIIPISRTQDTAGPMARTVADAVSFFGAVDPAWGDPRGFRAAVAPPAGATLRVGLARAELSDAAAADIRAVCDDAVAMATAALGWRSVAVEASLLDRAERLRAELDGQLPDVAGDRAVDGERELADR